MFFTYLLIFKLKQLKLDWGSPSSFSSAAVIETSSLFLQKFQVLLREKKYPSAADVVLGFYALYDVSQDSDYVRRLQEYAGDMKVLMRSRDALSHSIEKSKDVNTMVADLVDVKQKARLRKREACLKWLVDDSFISGDSKVHLSTLEEMLESTSTKLQQSGRHNQSNIHKLLSMVDFLPELKLSLRQYLVGTKVMEMKLFK
jgi:hypothetical protein